jgi:MGT family glycosyltransferase
MAGSIVVVSMRERGHLNRMLPLVEGFVARGRVVHVLTDSLFRAEVEGCGAQFVDLFAGRPPESVDATSFPVVSRYMAFSVAFLDDIAREVEALEPELIVYDTFAIVAPLVGRRLGVPYVNVCAGHAMPPARADAAWRAGPLIRTSAACWSAVATLREEHGVPTASRFAYGELSPYLNVCCEPPEYLHPADRAALEPLVFFGSVAPGQSGGGGETRPPIFGDGVRRAYVSFGTIIWRYFAAEALAALDVLSEVFSAEGVETVISLGGHAVDPEVRRRLIRPGIRVEHYVDQWAVLGEADLFVTHHGLNSTHEAAFLEVPMVSYPFFHDQPVLARRCQELGLAVPLADTLGAPVEAARITEALAVLERDREPIAARLAVASSWERGVIASRGDVVEQMLALAPSREPLQARLPA